MPKKIELNLENQSFWSRLAILLAPADEAVLFAARSVQTSPVSKAPEKAVAADEACCLA